MAHRLLTAFNENDPYVANLLYSWDAMAVSSFTKDGSNRISNWADLVTGFGAAQSTGAAQPLYNSTGLNGRPTVVSDGTDYLVTPSFSITALSIFAIAENNNSFPFGLDVDVVFEQGFSTRNANGFVDTTQPIFNNATYSGSVAYYVNGTSVSNNQPLIVNRPYLLSVIDSAKGTTTGAMGILATAAGAAICRGKISELRIYNRALNNLERRNLESILMPKWGIT